MMRMASAGAASRDGGGAQATAIAAGERGLLTPCAPAGPAHATSRVARTRDERCICKSPDGSEGRPLRARLEHLSFEIANHLLCHDEVLALLELLHQLFEVG